MSLSHPELQRLAELQIQDFKLAEQISQIKMVLSKLCDDQVDTTVIIQIHNKTVCAENKAKAAAQASIGGDQMPEGVVEMVEMITGGRGRVIQANRKPDHVDCATAFSFSLKECPGIHVLNTLLEQKRIERAVINQETEVLLRQLITETTIDQALISE